MSATAAQAEAFFSEVLRGGEVFGLGNAQGFATPEIEPGRRAMPFWSRRSRAERVRSTVLEYRSLRVVALPLEQWRDVWLPGLARDGLRVGVNWSGPRASGEDLAPDEVRARLAAEQVTGPEPG